LEERDERKSQGLKPDFSPGWDVQAKAWTYLKATARTFFTRNRNDILGE
jgi:hypothetical protein